MPSNILGAVLAGGQSRRMGADKALLPIAGRPMIRHAVETLAEVLSKVVVVSAPGRDYALPQARTIFDLQPGRGPLAGLQAALSHADGREVFALACDLPMVSARLVEHVVGGVADDAGEPRTLGDGRPWARVPLWRGRLQPLCALYAPSCLPEVEACLEENRLAVRELLRRIDVVTLPITSELPFYRPDLLRNVNRPASLAEPAAATRSERATPNGGSERSP